jgi:peptidoglycan/xylan/chitin deacetylase (PgdA/CDA1 family)
MLAALLFSSAVALTFDDLPGSAIPLNGRCDDAAKLRWNEKLIGTLRAHHAPALGLVVASNACDELTPFLNAWLDAGHDLGNHTFSHRDLNFMPIAEYEKDIVRGEPRLRDALTKHGKTLRYFRHPLLHTGNSPEVKKKLATFLGDHHYTVAPVTLDSQEWVFAAVYSRALERGDKALARRVADAYVPFMESVVAFFERRTREVLGRDIPHVLLLHMNALNADRLDALLRMLERRGYRFITVGEALRDPAYALPDGYTGPRGISWIHRWGLARGMPIVEEPQEPEWVAREFRATSSSP